MLQVATKSTDPRAFDLLVSGMDARVKVSRFRQAAKLDGKIGPNLAARLKVFEDQSIKLRNKLAHSTILPSDTPDHYEIVSILKQPTKVLNRSKLHQNPEKLRSDRIWKHAIWLNSFCFDLSAATSGSIKSKEYEIEFPKTPVLLAGRL